MTLLLLQFLFGLTHPPSLRIETYFEA